VPQPSRGAAAGHRAILAGSSPLLAIRYQIVVVFMQAAATAIGSLLFVRLAAGRYLTAAHQLRRYLL
jgi:putative ABC transport system permease protein